MVCPRLSRLLEAGSMPGDAAASFQQQPRVRRRLPIGMKGRTSMATKKSSSTSRTRKAATKKSSSKKKSSTRKYSPKAGKSVEREMKAFKQGKLKSGSGRKVTEPETSDRDWIVRSQEIRRQGAEEKILQLNTAYLSQPPASSLVIRDFDVLAGGPGGRLHSPKQYAKEPAGNSPSARVHECRIPLTASQRHFVAATAS